MIENLPQELDNNSIDDVVSVFKVAANFIPAVGPLISELLNKIPGQRIDRICSMLKSLREQVDKLDEGVQERMKTSEFSSLIEEAIKQAADSSSEERLNYIISILKNSLTDEEIEVQDTKHLMSLLNRINDSEVIWLKWWLLRPYNKFDEFYLTHEKVLSGTNPSIVATKKEHERAVIKKSYLEHLAQLGLLKRLYKRQSTIEDFEKVDPQDVIGYDNTDLGKLLLKRIGLLTPEEEDL
ncbi:MAG: hypothetical protein KDD67_05340 [Ignavibacteriae bacterium]|nr:hypothetical protein [Ignavibacteriota bacterium]MCB9216251.1 hypothetical protein [Ignavibacteria bacterium]